VLLVDDGLSELVPLNDALGQVRISEDKWQRYVRWGLMRRPETIPGTNRLGITRRRVERLRQLLAIEKALPGRPTERKLAFWFAFKGAEILRPELAAEYIDTGIRQFFGALRRELRLFLPVGYDLRNLRAGPQTQRLGQRFADFVLRQSRLKLNDAQHHFFYQWLSHLFTILLETVYTDVPKRSLALRLRPVADPMFDDPSMARPFADEFARFLIEYGSEFRDPDTGQNLTLGDHT
jgi:hypothetical protein